MNITLNIKLNIKNIKLNMKEIILSFVQTKALWFSVNTNETNLIRLHCASHIQ